MYVHISELSLDFLKNKFTEKSVLGNSLQKGQLNTEGLISEVFIKTSVLRWI